MYICCLFLLVCFRYVATWPFSEQNDNFSNYSSKMKVDISGYMVAFADFNSDRATDVFVLDTVNEFQKIDVILMPKETQKSATRINLLQYNNTNILGVVAGDFNGDSLIDLLIHRRIVGSYTVDIAYGVVNKDAVTIPKSILDGNTFLMQPLHLDWNADMIGDLLCQLSNQSFIVLLGQKNKTFSYEIISNMSSKMDTITYSKFVDINNDGQADILFIGRKDGKFAMTSYAKIGQKFVYYRTFTASTTAALIGQGVVGDFKFIGQLSMIVPMCRNKSCSDSYLMLCNFTDFTCSEAFMTLNLAGSQFQFLPGSSITKLSLSMPEIVPISCGDLHLSGNIECLMIVSDLANPTARRVVLLTHNNDMNFTLKALDGKSDLTSNVNQVAVFDIWEDGIPDVIVAQPQGSSGLISPLLHESTNDQYFIKVLVLNGLCYNPDTCPGGRLPYGIPLPGVVVSYSTESSNGGIQQSISTVCADSDYSSLQLPYAHFGLGAFANYVEKLYIKLPYNTIPRQHSLSFIVPKTQIVIIPYPLDDPSKWTNKLFLEPFRDKKVIYVAAALLGSFLIVAIITCILQYLEVKEDRLEKMQEAQKFHFDAM